MRYVNAVLDGFAGAIPAVLFAFLYAMQTPARNPLVVLLAVCVFSLFFRLLRKHC